MTLKPTRIATDHPVYETSLPYMLRLSAPMIVSTVSFTIMQFVDRFMVSRLGTDALAAVLPAGYVSLLPGGFALGAMTSLNTFVSQSLGRNDKAACSNYFWQMMYMGLVYFVLVAAVMVPAAPWIFQLMRHPAEVIPLETVYLRILLYAHIAAVVNWSSNQFFMGIHRPIVTMCTSLCGQIVNVLANYTLIFGKFGFPRMGIAGAGWGTFVGIAVAATFNMVVFLGPGVNASFHSRHTLHLDARKMRNLLRVGVPAGIGLMVNVALWGVILSSLVGRFGKASLAATSAVLSYASLSVMPVVGVSTALTAAVGKTIGAGRKELAPKQTSLCLRIALVYMGVVGVGFLLFRRPLMAFWSPKPEVIDAGSKILVCAALYQVFHATRIVYNGALRGAGDTVWLALISVVGAAGVLGLGGLAIVILWPSLGAIGPWIAAMLSIMFVGLANRWRFHTDIWQRIDLFGDRPVAAPSSDVAGD
jgi:MATE family multidrug resistance protein